MKNDVYIRNVLWSNDRCCLDMFVYWRGRIMIDEKKLKPCPFCGYEVKIIDLGIDEDDHYYMMQCLNEKCNSATCFGEVSKEEFIMRWNNMKKGYGRAWKRIRDKYVSEHPFCEECLNKGIITKAEEVHHKLKLANGGTHDRNNLIALCKTCHAKMHTEEVKDET